jgi:hypothetical protein
LDTKRVKNLDLPSPIGRGRAAWRTGQGRETGSGISGTQGRQGQPGQQIPAPEQPTNHPTTRHTKATEASKHRTRPPIDNPNPSPTEPRTEIPSN